MKSLTIKKKMLILIGAIMLILAVVSAVSIISTRLMRKDAEVLNIMGRQRMISQDLAKSALSYNMIKSGLKTMESEVSNLNKYITKMRSAYVKNVVVPAKKSGLKISMTPSTEGHPAVPFPATFTKIVNAAFSESSKMDIDMVSDNPINPKKALKDSIDKEAFDFLSKNKDKMFTKSVEENKGLFVRIYTADIATLQGCASCHTAMEGRNYSVGDILGIRRFNIFYSADVITGRKRLKPSTEEFEATKKLFTESHRALSSGGKYPVDLKMSSYHKMEAIKGAKYQSKFKEIDEKLKHFIKSVETFNSTELNSLENWKAQDDIEVDYSKLRKLNNDLVLMYEEDVRGRNDLVVSAFFIMAAIALLGFIAIYYFINKAIFNPLDKVVKMADSVSKGDLTIALEVKSNDEMGQLSSSLNSMTNGLNDIVSKISDTSNQLGSSVNLISTSSNQLVTGSQDQTRQTDQVAAAVEEMSATVLEVAQNSTDASSLASKASKVAMQGGKIVAQTINGMNSISNAVNGVAETVESLGKNSDQIGEIISVIDDIADQTNLLALNAAIEAARAGEQGRGFAVVADEVRTLAERTTKATKEIAEMIKKIQQDTYGAVDSMKEGTGEVENGVRLANEAGDSLKQIVEVVQGVTDMITQIATASQEQSAASEEISSNVEAVATIAKESTNSINETAEATNELSRMAEDLKELVEKFKLRK